MPAESRLVVEAIVAYYESKVQQLETRVKELEDQLSKNSRNSSKPPSTDEFDKPAPKSLRKKTGRQAGGQIGHDGTNLKMTASPDVVERHKVAVCVCCQKSLQKQEVIGIVKRQVYDLPPLELSLSEHQVEVKRFSCGHVNRANFPLGVDHYVQYGPNIKSLLVYIYAGLPVAAL